MPGRQSAVGAGSPKPNGARSIETRVIAVEGRMDALEQTLVDNRAASAKESQDTHALLNTLITAVGAPATGPAQPATGVYWALDKVAERVVPFERRFEQFKGGLKAITVAAVPVGALLWFSEGQKLTHLLSG